MHFYIYKFVCFCKGNRIELQKGSIDLLNIVCSLRDYNHIERSLLPVKGCQPLLGYHGNRTRKGVYRAILDMTRDLGIPGLIRRTSIHLLWQAMGTEDLFKPEIFKTKIIYTCRILILIKCTIYNIYQLEMSCFEFFKPTSRAGVLAKVSNIH